MNVDVSMIIRAAMVAVALLLTHSPSLFGQSPVIVKPAMSDVAAMVGLDFKHFSPFTVERHLHLTMGSGVAWIDIDNDGWPDVCFGQGAAWTGNPERPFHDEESLDRVFRNRHGKFTDVTRNSGIINSRYSMGLAVGDFDNDGFSDLSISCFGRPRLYRNNGDGTFEDVSIQLSSNPWIVSASCTWVDADIDGLLDLYVANYLKIDEQQYAVCTQTYRGKEIEIPCPPRKYEWPVDTLFKNPGDGRFVDASKDAGLTNLPRSAGLGVITNDFNEDQFPDLYVANDTTANFLLAGDGTGRFTDDAIVGGAAFNRIGESEAGMGVCSGDVDGDGRLDIFVGNYYGESNTLYRNEGHGLFLDVTSEFGLAAPSRTRLAFGTLLCDFNNDSWLDLFVANGHLSDRLTDTGMQIPFRQKSQLLVNDQGRRFKDVSVSSGPYFQREVLGRGCAAADFDLDGDLDIVVQHLNDQAALLQNNSDSNNRSVSVKLIGRKGNRDAIGAKLEVQLPNQSIVRQRDGSSSYLSCNDGCLVVGVGERDQSIFVRCAWENGTATSSSEIRPGQRVFIVEGSDRSSEDRVLEIPE